MQEWREVADRVRNTLLPIAVGTRTSHFLALVKAANLKLSTHLNFSRVILRGDTDPEIIYAAIPRLPPRTPTPSTSSSSPATSTTASERSTPWPAACSCSTACASASPTATRGGRPGSATTPPPYGTPTSRCSGCAAPPRGSRRCWTPTTRPCRSLPGHRHGSRGSRRPRASRAAPSTGSPRRRSWCA
ncbi:hypothetical protein HU200_055647 [Digitaria exilis]|uniref:Uncharacterized protein n=1 Tax=Digitaria exilis TaxID=1010633 RepID=A0A835AGR9_9POAL|nr:hypothetical protein HU200_055647 [Digitaria exilis]